ncbi:hypothetical protein NHX12_007587 [Muraenolepis orangiensis]|uniref:THAP-type domain-containing protein n=1 Tax=Muraenolepis orangiensis TaxID=630683 RepID=A0A9Q0DSP4_9TELE|nr:hypothetical protein NHX12_007587 [Muraenolepis orangiensis]
MTKPSQRTPFWENRRTPGTCLSFYRFPRDPERKRRWVDAVNRQGWQPNDGSRLCSTHFISGKQVKNPRSPDYVPSIFSPPAPDLREPEDMKEPDDSELQDKQHAKVEAANALLFLQGQGRDPIQTLTPEEDHLGHETPSVPPSATDDDDDDESDEEVVEDGNGNFVRGSKRGCVAVKEEQSSGSEEALGVLQKENQALRESLEKMSLSESSLRNDPEKVRFYTGLPNYYVLETVMWLLAPHMDDDDAMASSKASARLSKFQQLLLTLVRLRLDLRNQDLAYRFGVGIGTVTRAVRRAVDAMSSTLVPTAVFWPSRAELRKNLPSAVRAAHPDCAVIIDFFSVSLEQPASRGHAPARAQLGDGNTLKYLIGVAPQGVVTFVSRGVAGDVSDKVLAEECGFLCKLLPGDVVLASRDLDIGQSVAARGAMFKIAGGGTERESALSLLGHVERVIAMVRHRYAVLMGPVESCFASDRSTFDKVVQVACALNNLCISAAPLE